MAAVTGDPGAVADSAQLDVPETVQATLVALGTATISDALDRLGLPGSALDLMPLAAGQCMVGPAFTVRYVPVGPEPGTVGDYLDECVAGQVIVLDNAGRVDCTVWGDILTTLAHEVGVAGTAINGVCRDVRVAQELGYPIYSRGRFMRTGKDRVEVAGTNQPVVLGDAQVRPGDLVVGDEDGVVVVPRRHVDRVASQAAAIDDAESRIIEAVRDGLTLTAARKRYGYHQLQRRDTP